MAVATQSMPTSLAPYQGHVIYSHPPPSYSTNQYHPSSRLSSQNMSSKPSRAIEGPPSKATRGPQPDLVHWDPRNTQSTPSTNMTYAPSTQQGRGLQQWNQPQEYVPNTALPTVPRSGNFYGPLKASGNAQIFQGNFGMTDAVLQNAPAHTYMGCEAKDNSRIYQGNISLETLRAMRNHRFGGQQQQQQRTADPKPTYEEPKEEDEQEEEGRSGPLLLKWHKL